MSQSIRKKLGKELYQLIQFKNKLIHYFDCDQVYGSNTITKEEYEDGLKELNDKIETLQLLRNALKEPNANNDL